MTFRCYFRNSLGWRKGDIFHYKYVGFCWWWLNCRCLRNNGRAVCMNWSRCFSKNTGILLEVLVSGRTWGLFSNVKLGRVNSKSYVRKILKVVRSNVKSSQSYKFAALFRCILSTSKVCFGEMFAAQILYYNLIIM
jgi:hypothetical protein